MRILLIVALFNLLTFSCMSPKPVYKYADGSANLYTLQSSTLEYSPVKKEESSTGMYSGGEPKKVTITAAEYDTIRKILESSLNNTAIHIEDRIKTSGAITEIDGNKTRSAIIKPGTKEIVEIEKALKTILDNH